MDSLLRWLITFTLICVGMALVFTTGLAGAVNKADVTKISFVICGLFFYYSLWAGLVNYRLYKAKKNITKQTKKFLEKTKFISGIFLDLGMIGTVIGFIYMLSSSFGSIDVSNTTSLHMALKTMAVGMGTALYTTATGLICSVLLRLQTWPIRRLVSDKEGKSDDA